MTTNYAMTQNAHCDENKLLTSKVHHSREDEYIGKRVIEMEVPGKRRRGRPKTRWSDSTVSRMTCRRENCQGMKLKTEFNGGVS